MVIELPIPRKATLSTPAGQVTAVQLAYDRPPMWAKFTAWLWLWRRFPRIHYWRKCWALHAQVGDTWTLASPTLSTDAMEMYMIRKSYPQSWKAKLRANDPDQ
jgi:hypothetical protein